ncbi:hypothetical protein QBC44DRAFT_372588 [Cladorrhinum sp. PSN332]|nr:hypothetical protein QBC44DRAFT_372588 [Cladorrhinum sp. PSN332]
MSQPQFTSCDERNARLRQKWPSLSEIECTRTRNAIEIAALVLRLMVCQLYLSDEEYIGLAQKNILFYFALLNRLPLDGLGPVRPHEIDSHIGFFGPDLDSEDQAKLVEQILQEFGIKAENLSCKALLESDVFTRTFWDIPQLEFFRTLAHPGENWLNAPWTPFTSQETSGQLGLISLVWTEMETEGLAETIQNRLGTFSHQSGWKVMLSAKFPRIFRVSFTSSLSHDGFPYLQWVKVTEPMVDGNGMSLEPATQQYVLIAAILHQEPEQARFYDQLGRFIPPPLREECQPQFAFEDDTWQLGRAEGGQYTLVYAATNEHPGFTEQTIPQYVLSMQDVQEDLHEEIMSEMEMADGPNPRTKPLFQLDD